jgi:hypothetical protein
MLSSVEKNIASNYRHLHVRLCDHALPDSFTDEMVIETYNEVGVMPTSEIQDNEVLMAIREKLNLPEIDLYKKDEPAKKRRGRPRRNLKSPNLVESIGPLSDAISKFR